MDRQGKGRKGTVWFILAVLSVIAVVLVVPGFSIKGLAGLALEELSASRLSEQVVPVQSSSVAKAATSSPISTITDFFDEDIVALHSNSGAGDVTTVTALEDGQQATIRWDKDTGVPAFLAGPVTPPAAASLPEVTYAFLDENSDIYQISRPAEELSLQRMERDGLGMTHLRLAQVYKGVPVFGSQLSFHYTADGKISAINGYYLPGIDLSVEPEVGKAAAVETAEAKLGQNAVSSGQEPPELVILPQEGTSVALTWKVTLVSEDPPLRMVYFIDAHSGEVAAAYNALQDVVNRQTYTANYGTSIPGTLMMNEGDAWTGDAVVNAAYYNTGRTYDYYYNTFGRDSINGSGMDIRSTVHYRSGYNNAFWNGSQITFGDGDGYVFSPLANALDVVAHEMTHGVTQYTAGLVYSYQSGALNESYSDVMGAMVDRDDWLMGEDVYSPQTPGDALRSLSDPPRFGQPAHMNSYVNTSSDNGGVHANSGIPNKAAYNVAMAIGKDKMEQIWYRALTDYLTSSAQFPDARDASVQAAADLYGATSAEVLAVDSGFAAVGITGSGMPSQTTARIEIDHSYRGDLVVTLGVGDPSSPDWSTVVSNRQGGSANGLNVTVDIDDAVSHLPPSWGDRWYLKVYDAAGSDTGQITRFSITDHGNTYESVEVPVAIDDYQTSYAYVPTTDVVPPALVYTVPVDGDPAVAMGSSIKVTFSEDIDASTIDGSSFKLVRQADPNGEQVPAVVSYDSGTRTATLDPVNDLGEVRGYKAVITSDVTDQAGNHLAADYQWTFVVDPTTPSVTGVDPTGVVHTGNLSINAGYSDEDSGIDTDAVVVTIDDNPISGCEVTTADVTCEITGLADGDYTVGGSIADKAGNTTPLDGSFTVLDTTAPAFGNLDGVSAGDPGRLDLGGWAIDPDTSDPIDVHVYVNGRWAAAIAADGSRPDVGTAMPGYGDNHGFTGSISADAASNTVCAYGINNGPGNNVLLGCKIVDVQVNPFGALDGVSADSSGRIDVGGWAIDPDTGDPIDVHVYVNGQWGGVLTAAADRPDVGAYFPGYGDQHGFTGSVQANAAVNSVCAYGINTGAGGNVLLGCKTVTLPVDPFGNLDSAGSGNPGQLNLNGWAIDPNTGSAVDVHVYVNGRLDTILTADDQREDVGTVFPDYGDTHGFNGSADVSAGSNTVCAYAINQGPGGNALLGCKVVDVPIDPYGNLDSVSRGESGQLIVGGWAVDPDTGDPIDVHVYVNGRWGGVFTADGDRPDVGIAYPDYGDRHGYAGSVQANAAVNTVCAYGINTGAGGNVLLGCKTVTLPVDPFGNLDSVSRGESGQLIVGGWAVDPDTGDPIDVHVYVNGRWGGVLTADGDRPDVGTAYPGYGDNHGFSGIVAAEAGTNFICAYGINQGPGGNALLGCRTE